MAVNLQTLILNQQNQQNYNPNDQLSKEIWYHYLDNRQTIEQVRQKCEYRNKLSEILKNKYSQNVELFIVGSTANGFGTKTSDLDLCFYIKVYNEDQWISHRILNEMCSYFCKQFGYSQITNYRVVNAKVPIFKFRDGKYNFDVEINVNSEIGIRNTRLLYVYSTCDIRVAPLVLIVKKWAYSCNINDSHLGTLSSYNWQLMVIHYLQQCQPPILPSLQLLYSRQFDAYESVLNYVHLPQACFNTALMMTNRQSLGELFKGFLEYYSKFDYNRHAISVRLGQVISLYQCSGINWDNVKIGVEEPFNRQNSAYSVHENYSFTKIVNCFKETSTELKESNRLPRRILY